MLPLTGRRLGAARALCLALCVLGATPARAAPREDNRTRARRLVEEGERSYAAGAFEAALARFREAYEVWGEANLVFNIGQCHRQLGRDEPALQAYRDFLKLAPENDPLVPEARRLIGELEARAQAGAQAARAAEERAAAAARATAPAPAVPAARAARPPHVLRWVGVGVGAAGLALVGGGVAPALLAGRARDDLEGAAARREVFDPALEDRRKSLVLTSGLVFGIGGALVVTGATLFGLGLRSERRAAR